MNNFTKKDSILFGWCAFCAALLFFSGVITPVALHLAGVI